MSISARLGVAAPVTQRADIVRGVMTGDQPPKTPTPSGANDGWTMVGYLISGIALWSGIGWLADRWLHWGGIPIAIGAIVGAVLGIYLVLKRMKT